jgi:hypothetical protein
VGKRVDRPELVKHRRRWEYNIKEDIKRITWEGVNCINLVQEKHETRGVLKVITKYRVPKMD